MSGDCEWPYVVHSTDVFNPLKNFDNLLFPLTVFHWTCSIFLHMFKLFWRVLWLVSKESKKFSNLILLYTPREIEGGREGDRERDPSLIFCGRFYIDPLSPWIHYFHSVSPKECYPNSITLYLVLLDLPTIFPGTKYSHKNWNLMLLPVTPNLCSKYCLWIGLYLHLLVAQKNR